MSTLQGCCIHVAGRFKGTTHSTIEKDILDYGGSLAKQLKNTKITHVVSSEGRIQPSMQENATRETPFAIVSLDWLLQSIQAGAKLDEEPFDLTKKVQLDVEEAEEEEGEDGEELNGGEGEAAVGKKTKAKAKPKAKAKLKKRDREDEADGEEAAPKSTKVQVVQKGITPVDYRFPHASSAHVFVEADGIPYDALLNQTDIGKNMNKFYLIQVLESDSVPSRYWTLNVWGRTGETGQKKVLEHNNVDEAIKDFSKKFREKTKLAWDNRFDDPHQGKYTYMEPAYDLEEDDDEQETNGGPSNEAKKARTDDMPAAASTLNEETQDLMRFLFDTSIMDQTMTTFEYDSSQLPLGKLSKATIEAGFIALDEISELIANNDLALALYEVPLEAAFRELTNKYYTLIPHNFGRNRPPIIDSISRVALEFELITTLSKLKITSELMKSPSSAHPLDAQYQSLRLGKLDSVDPASEEFEILAALLDSTQSTMSGWELDLTHAFKIERPSETDAFEAAGNSNPEAGRRRLLWYGARSSDFAALLHAGFQIPSTDTPVVGQIFGKGLYFNSLSSKAATYCYHSISNNEGLLLLSEVQLGPIPFHQVNAPQPLAPVLCAQEGMKSTWGVGINQPGGWDNAGALSEELSGVEMPSLQAQVGEYGKGSGLLYDEYVVYDPNQVKMKYLLRIKFNEPTDA